MNGFSPEVKVPKIRLYVYYDIRNSPYGGANSFFKALLCELNKDKLIDLARTPSASVDAFLYNSFSTGTRRVQRGLVRNMARLGSPNLLSFALSGFRRRQVFLIHRVDGIAQLYGRLDKSSDDLQLQVNRFADHTIFQSNFCQQSFLKFGYKGESDSVIHNGVDQSIFGTADRVIWDKQARLKVIACSWSSNVGKGHDMVAALSSSKDMDVTFVGNWPAGVPPNRVRLLRPMSQDALAEEFRSNHIFLHAAMNDPCPNVVIEAMSTGLPVLYRNSGGTPELVGFDFGCPYEGDSDIRMQTICENYDRWIKNLFDKHRDFSIEHAAAKYMQVIKQGCRGIRDGQST